MQMRSMNQKPACSAKSGRGIPRQAYAVLDMAHPEPPYEKGMIFGLGKLQREDVDSLIPFPIAICKECRRKYNLVENFKFTRQASDS